MTAGLTFFRFFTSAVCFAMHSSMSTSISVPMPPQSSRSGTHVMSSAMHHTNTSARAHTHTHTHTHNHTHTQQPVRSTNSIVCIKNSQGTTVFFNITDGNEGRGAAHTSDFANVSKAEAPVVAAQDLGLSVVVFAPMVREEGGQRIAVALSTCIRAPKWAPLCSRVITIDGEQLSAATPLVVRVPHSICSQ